MLTEKTGKKTARDGLLYMRLADEILAYIRENHIQNGERIPSERKLAEMFSTSRTSVREAVRILQNKNILEVQIGNGMFLKSELPETTYHIELWKIDYMELLDIKTILEFQIIAELCEYIPPAELRSIEMALRRLEAGYNKGIFDQYADTLFHQRIRGCSKNQTLIQLLDNLIMKLDEYGTQMEEMKRGWYETIPLHRDLLEAIKAHDVEKAREAFYGIYELDKKALDSQQGRQWRSLKEE